MGYISPFLVLALCAGLYAQSTPYKPGDRVDVDVIMAGAPERGMWKPGTVKSLDAAVREVIILTDAATDNGGRTIGIPMQSAGKWIRPSSSPRPAPPAQAPPRQSGSAVLTAPPESASNGEPQGILNCPVDQPKVAAGSRPNPQKLSEVIRCLFEVRGQSRAERSIKVEIRSLEIGTSRACVPREDFECGTPGHTIFPALVRWTKTDYYTHSIQWSDNESVFNCFVNSFGQWQCGLGRRIRDGQIQNRPR